MGGKLLSGSGKMAVATTESANVLARQLLWQKHRMSMRRLSG